MKMYEKYLQNILEYKYMTIIKPIVKFSLETAKNKLCRKYLYFSDIFCVNRFSIFHIFTFLLHFYTYK